MKKAKSTYKIKSLLIICAALVGVVIMLSVLKNNRFIAENIFSKGIARLYLSVVGTITSVFPFSVYEVLLVCTVISLIVFSIKTIRRFKQKKAKEAFSGILKLTAITLSIITVYLCTASFAYQRQPQNIAVSSYRPSDEELKIIVQYYIDDYNYLANKFERDEKGNSIMPYSFKELTIKCKEEFKIFEDDEYYNKKLPIAKPMIFSEIMSYLNFSGMFFAPTAEANINISIPQVAQPVTVLHELAHASGVMEERSANNTAYYLAINSKDDYIRYSGYFFVFKHITNSLLLPPETHGNAEDLEDFYIEKVQGLDKKISAEIKNYSEYWTKKTTLITDVGEFINNIYLKISGLKDGTSNYIPLPPVIVDSGETDKETQQPILKKHYSLIQKMFIDNYINKNGAFE